MGAYVSRTKKVEELLNGDVIPVKGDVQATVRNQFLKSFSISKLFPVGLMEVALLYNRRSFNVWTCDDIILVSI